MLNSQEGVENCTKKKGMSRSVWKDHQGQSERTVKANYGGKSQRGMSRSATVSWGQGQGCKGQRTVESAGRNVKASTYQVLQVLRRAQASQVGRGCHGDQADPAVPRRADQAVQVPLSHNRVTMMHTIPEDSDTVSVHCETS